MKMLLHMIFGFSLALLGPSAGCPGASYSGRAVITQNIPQDLMITLERAGGRSISPDYKLIITADGVVVFEGRRSNPTIAKYAFREIIRYLKAKLRTKAEWPLPLPGRFSKR